MTPSKCYRRCEHALTWRVTESDEVVVLCELEHDEIAAKVCEFCQEYEA